MANRKAGKKKAKAAAKVSAKASKGSVKPGKANVKKYTMQFRARPVGNMNSKPRLGFGDPVAPPQPHPSFVAIPSTHKQPSNLSYDLADAIDASALQAITSSG